jgi:hypothetical protein
MMIPQTPNYILNGLVGWWRTNDNALDSSGQANNGTLVNSPSFVAGKTGRAVSLNGTSQYISRSTPQTWPGETGTTFSVCAFITNTSASGANDLVILNVGNGSNDNIYFSLANIRARLNFSAYNGSVIGVYNTSGALNVPSDGSWVSVIGVHSSNLWSTYVNGTFCASASGGEGTLTGSSTQLSIGSIVTAARYYPGKIQDIRLYNRALSTTEITAIANLRG